MSTTTGLSTFPGEPLLLKFKLSLSVVLGSVNTVVRVVDKVWPWNDVTECGRIARVPVSNSLHVLGHLGLSVQGLALLNLVDHFAHVHLDLAAVLTRTVEAHCPVLACGGNI